MDSAKPSPALASSNPSQKILIDPPDPSARAHGEASDFPLREISRAVLATTTDGVYGTDAHGITTFLNCAATKMTGWAADELVGKPHDAFANQVSPQSHSGLSESLLSGQRERGAHESVSRGEDAVFLRKDGTFFPAAYIHTSVLEHGRLWGTVVIFRDISEDRRKEAWEKAKGEVCSAILRQHPLQAILHLLADAFRARHPSKSVAIFLCAGEIFRLEAEAGLPQRVPRLMLAPVSTPPISVHPVNVTTIDTIDRMEPPGAGDIAGVLPGPDLTSILESGVQLCMSSPLVSGSGETLGCIAVFDQQTTPLDRTARETLQTVCDLARMAVEHRRLHDEVLHRSHFDRLTGLPNQKFFEDQLRGAMAVARRQGKMIAVCCLDLDHFKQINDTLGHDVGDLLFKAVNERLNTSVRDFDLLSRPKGDEFLLALCELEEPADAESICHRLLKDLRTPFLVDGHYLGITASAGISVFPDHGETSEELLRNANVALRIAKRSGAGAIQAYSSALGRQNRRAAEMVEALVSAVAEGQFHVAYQPIYAINQEIVAFEALLRWKHPEWGQLSPLEFIPVAETTGLIVPMGDWVIGEVCRQATEWDAAGVPPVKMFANISGVQLARPDFASKIAEALQQSGLAPERLELEITESWVISDLKGAARKLQKLRDLGIGIAIDDFGTGYSMFNYLQELPLDTLKIDRSFIQRLDGSAAKPSTVRAITGLARQLNLKTVAEGVETERHVAELKQIGCDLMQGFFLARPLKPQAACALLKKQESTKTFLEMTTKSPATKHANPGYVVLQK